MRVGKEQKLAARRADLHDFLIANYPETVRKIGPDRLRHKEYESLVITKNMGFYHNSACKSGNGIDYLMNYLGYSFQDAVMSLIRFDSNSFNRTITESDKTFDRPIATTNSYKQTFGYLKGRGIMEDLIADLIHKKLIYQEAVHNNICFDGGDWIEWHGSLSHYSAKGIASGSSRDGYWSFTYCDKPIIPYGLIFESAVDAMSFYCLKRRLPIAENAVFYSLGGVKQSALNKIITTQNCDRFVLCVDNDEAGDNFASVNKNLERFRPYKGDRNNTYYFKDWNDYLKDSLCLH
ncbi:MAG: hypothetical protein K0R54_3977 [Clostridiaceae bacterium]|jgi:hypothetical protein|nr:hypothetical protein [Clostridiaceae bacterium]